MKIVYDVGCNIGANIKYYLKKFDKVVAIDANPKMCEIVSKMGFDNVVVENCAVSDSEGEDTFYLHGNNLLSRLGQPSEYGHSEEIVVQKRRLSDIVKKYGSPYYIKLDVEWHDDKVMGDLFSNGIYPFYISSEIQQQDVVDLLVGSKKYGDFKIVDGRTMPVVYKDAIINTKSGTETYSFHVHSAGPFYDDIKTPSYDVDGYLQELKRIGLGWKDTHAKLIGF